MVESDTRFLSSRRTRLPFVLVVDTSASMQNAMSLLDAGFQSFAQAFAEVSNKQGEVAIVTFPPVSVVAEFCAIADFQPPLLTAGGSGSLVEAISCALHLLEDRKAFYRANHARYLRPRILLISDGHFSPDDDWQSSAVALARERANNRLSVFAFGVPGADMEVLSKFSDDSPKAIANFISSKAWESWGGFTSLSSSRSVETTTAMNDRLLLPSLDFNVPLENETRTEQDTAERAEATAAIPNSSVVGRDDGSGEAEQQHAAERAAREEQDRAAEQRYTVERSREEDKHTTAERHYRAEKDARGEEDEEEDRAAEQRYTAERAAREEEEYRAADKRYKAKTVDRFEEEPRPADTRRFAKKAPVETREPGRSSPNRNNMRHSKARSQQPAVNQHSIGSILWNLPQRMRIGRRERVEVRLGDAGVTESQLRASLKGRGFPETDQLEVAPLMRVSLISDAKDFDIISLNSPDQYIRPSSVSRWDFYVTPLRAGTRTLRILVSMRLKVESKDEIFDLPSYERDVIVAVAPLYLAAKFMAKNWQWSVGTVLLPLLVWAATKTDAGAALLKQVIVDLSAK